MIPHSFSLCYSDKRHSLTATAINDLITDIPYLFPHSRSFTTGVSIFTSLTHSYDEPSCWDKMLRIMNYFKAELDWIHKIIADNNLKADPSLLPFMQRSKENAQDQNSGDQGKSKQPKIATSDQGSKS